MLFPKLLYETLTNSKRDKLAQADGIFPVNYFKQGLKGLRHKSTPLKVMVDYLNVRCFTEIIINLNNSSHLPTIP